VVTLAPIVLSSIALMASGRPNPLYAPNPVLTISCSIPKEYGGADGLAWSSEDADDRINYRIDFQPDICKRLNAFARSPKLRGDDFSDSAVGMAFALRVAVHEPSHVFFYRNYPGWDGHTEAGADCRAVMNVARFARMLGASKATARRVYRLNTEIGMFDDYASACASGRPFKPRRPFYASS
jgi:hypothetical protein